MCSQSVTRTIAFVVVALAIAAASEAECLAITLKKGERLKGPVPRPTLVFSGTVTATNPAQYTVSVDVDRVWKGQLRRHTTLWAAPVTEGIGVSYFQVGEQYLVTLYQRNYVFTSKDAAEGTPPAGTVGVMFGCDTPERLSEAKESLKHLGRGKAPLP